MRKLVILASSLVLVLMIALELVGALGDEPVPPCGLVHPKIKSCKQLNLN